jgi:hypothetical protein
MPRAKKTEETKPVAKKPAAKKTTTKPKATEKKPTAKKAPKAQPITPKTRAKKVENNEIIKPTNDLDKFPYETFPYRLEHQELKGKKVCWFSHESHVHKYIERHKLNRKDYVAECFSNLH